MVTKVDKQEQVAPRNKRQPFGVARSKLNVNQPIEGYHLRWINDEPGRIQQALDGGYSFVEPDEVKHESNDENKVKVLGGSQRNGIDPMYQYLMKIPMEYYLEDKEFSKQQVDRIDDAIKGGKISLESGDNRYIPSGGISIKT